VTLRRGNVLKFALKARWWDRDEDWAESVTAKVSETTGGN